MRWLLRETVKLRTTCDPYSGDYFSDSISSLAIDQPAPRAEQYNLLFYLSSRGEERDRWCGDHLVSTAQPTPTPDISHKSVISRILEDCLAHFLCLREVSTHNSVRSILSPLWVWWAVRVGSKFETNLTNPVLIVLLYQGAWNMQSQGKGLKCNCKEDDRAGLPDVFSLLFCCLRLVGWPAVKWHEVIRRMISSGYNKPVKIINLIVPSDHTGGNTAAIISSATNN